MNPNSPSSPPGWRDQLLAYFQRRGWRGFISLHRLLKPAAGRPEIQITTRYGSRFFVSPTDAVDAHVLREGFYESEVLDAILPALAAPDAVLWVIGANFGLHTVTAKLLHPSARVVAFEPSPAMSSRLLENSALNGVSIELHAYALAGEESVLPFHPNTSGNSGMSTLRPSGGFAFAPPFFVATYTPASIIERGLAPAPTALVIDAEGAEEEIINGFGRHLKAPGLRQIIIEAPNEFLKDREPAGLYADLMGAGFTLKKLQRRERTAHMLSNFLAIKP